MSEIKTIRYKTSVVLLPGGEYTRAELERILSLMDRANETMRKATEPRCLYPDCVGGKQGTICHDSCPGGNPSFG